MLTVGQIVSKDTQDPENGTVFRDLGQDCGSFTHLYKLHDGRWVWAEPSANPAQLIGGSPFEQTAKHADGWLEVVDIEPPSEVGPFPVGTRVEYIGDTRAHGWEGTVVEHNFNPRGQVRVEWDNGIGAFNTPLVRNLRKIKEDTNAVPKRAEILREAERLITGDRNQTYGEPMDNFRIIADYWNTFLSHKLKDGQKITPGDTAGMQILVKLAREKGGPKEDNKLDIAGYAACWAEVDKK